MAVHQLPVDVGVFARYLGDLVALLDRSEGWYGIFWQRDPGGMQACLNGVEIPPWDVVESLLQDLAAGRGPQYAEQQSLRASRLHALAAAAHDRLPGGHEALENRLDLMLREQTYAQGRAQELIGLLAGEAEGTPPAEQYANELAWTRDDHHRAAARITELRSRLRALSAPEQAVAPHPAAPGGWAGQEPADPQPVARPGRPGSGAEDPDAAATHDRFRPDSAAYAPVADASRGSGRAQGPYAAAGTAAVESVVPNGWFRPAPAEPDQHRRAESAGPADGAHPAGTPPGADVPPPAQSRAAKRRRPRGARFAGVENLGEEGTVAQPVPVLPVADDVPRGARYGGAPAVTDHASPAVAPVPEGASRAARETVAALGRLRAEGRSGEAHAVICEAAARPVGWLPPLAAELHRAGLAADWATLLWEVASQPAARLTAAADALTAAGRADDGRQLLRQGVSRSTDEIAAAVIALEDEGLAVRSRALLDAFVRVRTPEDTARVAEPDPGRLVPSLLAAARAVSPAHERDLVHALRVAGHL
ncbi:hypothetical protein [Streptomyces sp. NPDC002889]|uniref:hypothetical protein n=1 Tax=Streptomyces sp. NPDC002889 TaxID=3364669 RepID=UPI00369714F3